MLTLASGRRPSADDSQNILVFFGPHDQYDTSVHGHERDEPLFILRMTLVGEFQIVHPRREEPTRLLEGEPVLGYVGAVLRLIPCDFHVQQYTPLTYYVNGLFTVSA